MNISEKLIRARKFLSLCGQITPFMKTSDKDGWKVRQGDGPLISEVDFQSFC